VRIGHYLPAYRQSVHVQVALAMAREASWCAGAGHVHVPFFTDINGIARARNIAVATAMKAGCDVLLMQDSDTFALPEHNYSAIERLLATMIEHDAAVVGAPYPVRNGETMCCEPARPGEVYPGEVGTGLMLIDLRKLADLPRPWFRFVEADDGSTVTCGEDIYFCRLAKSAGYKVLVDYTIPVGHAFSTVVA
jgi:hypothetical protein